MFQVRRPGQSTALAVTAFVLFFVAVAAASTAASASLATAATEVEAASKAWIEAFNRGDYQACAAGYTDDASMQGRPLADLRGRPAIEEFWKGVLSQNPGKLVYLDPRIHVLDEGTAVLSAGWTMEHLGRGIITLERWEKQDDGTWLLAEDIFEIQEQFAPSQDGSTPR